ncbi:ArsA family ATPase [Streptomyces termitum]|uniref:ArsA family ATPase n=1 Tax=Streptomyces termitum TaxID=67368 RepID=UPI0033BD7112
MRIILVTGAGGAGRSTVAAATALAEARAGRRVLLVPDGDPGDGFGADPGDGTSGGTGTGTGAGAEGGPGALTVLRTDPAAGFRRAFLALQDRSGTLFDLLGAVPFEDAELTEPPGSRQFALLRALREAADGDHDVAVVDLPPLHDALAVLALPAQLRRYLRRLLPAERQAARALRPMLAQLAGVPMPAQWLYETTARWERELAAVQALVEAPGTTVRLVLEPGPDAARALRDARLGLALHGLALDAVLANRLLPAGSPDPWLAALADRQRHHLETLRATAGDLLSALPHLGPDPHHPADPALLAALPDPHRPAGPPAPAPRVEDRLAEDGVLVWHLPLPGAVKGELSLVRRGDELLLGAGPFRRALDLPAALRRCTVTGAGLVDGDLRIRFTPDPGLWPRPS